ncbi:hypothetical protein [Demequina aestuarii]|uniref:hypothetical protein n=1 Tax=Demequina aestuarii TaxID=327095 RepID=UPI0007831FEF|nr:hypothetical protein [Demequina aestuarii]
MAVVLLRLRLAIQRSGRGSWSSTRGVIIIGMWLLAVGAGVATGALVAFLLWLDGDGAAALAVLTVIFLGWLLMPLITPALQDQTVDPARLEMYPLTAREKVSGLLLGGLVAPTATGTLLAALGAVFAPGIGWGARALALVGAVVFTVMCVAWSRALQAMLSRATASRRGRDVALMASGLLGVGFYVGIQILTRNPEALVNGVSDSVVAVLLAWTPPGASLQMALDLDAGDAVVALGRAAYALAWVIAAIALWVWVLARKERGGLQSPARRRRSPRAGTRLALTGGLLRLSPKSPGGAAAAQYARYLFFRKPRAAQQTLTSLGIGGFLAHSLGVDASFALAGAMLGGLVAVSLSTGLLNYDGAGAEFSVISGAPMRAVLVGKAVVVATIALAALVVFVAVEAALGFLEVDVVGALICGAAAALWATAVGAAVSVIAPYDADKKSDGRTVAAFWHLGAILLVFTTIGIAAGVIWAVGGLGLGLVIALGALAASIAASWPVVAWAARRLDAHQLRVTQLILAG